MLSNIKQEIRNLINDKKFSEILTGSAWALSARVAATLFGLVLSIITVRYYGADIMGILSVLQSFLGLATIFTVLGTKTSILRLIPEHLVKYSPTSAFRLYRKTQYIVIGVSIFSGALFYFGSDYVADKIFSKQYLSFYLSLSAVFIVFKSIMLLNTQAVRGLRLSRIFALMQMLPSASSLLLLICATSFYYTKSNPIYTMLASLAITGIFGWLIMEKEFKDRMRHDDVIHKMPARDILSISLPMLMTATMYFVIGQTGIIMLGMFKDATEVGYYAVAVKLATLTGFVLAAINAVSGPKFSELFHSGRMSELLYVSKKSAKLVFWTTAPILISLIIIGRPLLAILFGQDFVVAYPVLVIVVIGQFANSIAGSNGMFMNMTGNQNSLRNFVLIAAILNIILNLFLIPRIGILGAAVASMVSSSFWNIAAIIFVKNKYKTNIGYFPTLM